MKPSGAAGCRESAKPVDALWFPGNEMEDERMIRLSKRMSKALRHRPERVGLTIDPDGWVPVADLLNALGISAADLH